MLEQTATVLSASMRKRRKSASTRRARNSVICEVSRVSGNKLGDSLETHLVRLVACWQRCDYSLLVLLLGLLRLARHEAIGVACRHQRESVKALSASSRV